MLTIDADLALAAARNVDAARSRGEALGKLCGVPIALKDALCTKGLGTTAGSLILTDDGKSLARPYLPPYDATVVSRLRAAGAVIVGKTNMDEFAMGSSNENSAFGVVKNPWDRTRTPGGSSGGSAVAVASGITPTSLGSDTGGSIRQPASFTGTVGVKPTYGRVSRYGLIAFASSLDQVGPFARDARSAARVLGAIAGHDANDSTTLDAPVDDYEGACGQTLQGLRVGLPKQYFTEGLDPEVEKQVRAAIDRLEALGCIVSEVSLPHTQYAVATYYVIATAEASSNLARFDGVRFGLRKGQKPGGSLTDLYRETRGAGFGTEVKRRIVLGTYVLSAGYYEAYYLRAQKVRALIRNDFQEAFRDVDVLATPVSPVAAFRLGERSTDPLSMYLSDIYTLPASLAGVPAISVPCGTTKVTDDTPALPIGLQLTGRPLGEATLLRVAHGLESE